MLRKLKKISSCFLLLIFLLPTAIKVEHHHEHHEFHEGSQVQFGSYHEKCVICNFEFAAFNSVDGVIDLKKDNPSDNYRNPYQPGNISNQPEFTSLLRGPPC